ncbi:MAG: hypothetical protein PXX73_04270 [Sideroxydans sp.]|nr:hypothetical protein [Sideroxydans sp.]
MSSNNNKLSITGKMDTLGANIVGIILATGAALSGVIVAVAVLVKAML